MQSKSIKACLVFSFVLFAATPAALRAEYIQDNKTQALQTEQTKARPLVFAGSPAVCKANYDQCMKGCDGAAQCSNQCLVNYNGCLR